MRRLGTRIVARHVEGYFVSGSMEAKLKQAGEKSPRERTAHRLAQGLLVGLREPMTDEEHREYAFTTSRRIWADREEFATEYHFDHDIEGLAETAKDTIIAERARKMAQLAVGHGTSDII